MKSDKFIGMVQPKILKDHDQDYPPTLHKIGCMGKITSFKETIDGHYLIELRGIIRFQITNEIETNKKYRECKISFENYYNDLTNKKEDIKFSDLEVFFIDLKKLFKKRGYVINWKEIEKQSLDQTINTLAMASPFSLEEKQVLLETPDLKSRKNKLGEIIKTYVLDDFSNTTIQ